METIAGPTTDGADLDAVRVFVQVVQAGGFTAAAKRLGMPKSTVSRRVSQLEARLGVRLLHRTTRSVALSDEGAVYFARVERALTELSEAEAALGLLRDEPRGVLRVTAPVDVGHELLAGIVARFERTYPEVAVVLDIDNRRVDLIAEGFDLALRATGRLDDSSLVARKLLSTTHALFASPGYLRDHGEPSEPSELAAHRLLLFRSEQLRARWRLARDGDDAVEIDARGRTSSTDLGFLRRAAIEGLGITALPSFMCCDDLAVGRLARVLPAYDAGHSHLYGVYPSARYLTPKVRAFLDLAAEQLEEHERSATARAS